MKKKFYLVLSKREKETNDIQLGNSITREEKFIVSMATPSNFVKACFFFFTFFFLAWIARADNIFNVKGYGAVADGKTYSTKAFLKAWSEACATAGNSTMLIPEGSYLVGALAFSGPCQGTMDVQLKGTLLATTNLNAYTQNWIDFQHVNGLTISGGGKLDGQGAPSWPQNLCPKKWNCKLLPISLVLSFVNNAKISDITSLNPMLFHMNIFASRDVEINSITITAPGDSPNTDGIHMGGSTNVAILNSNIGTGDDCISIGDKITNVTIFNVTCGPGHGISVGSLGKNKNEGNVVGLTVTNCTITETMNGVRIKTWENSPVVTTASNFIFDGIVMNNVSNPIIIDQKYCPYVACPESFPSKVKISQIKFRNIRGTSATTEAVKLVCSNAVPCEGVELSNIDLEYVGVLPGNTTATCVNVQGTSNGNVKPPSCIGGSSNWSS